MSSGGVLQTIYDLTELIDVYAGAVGFRRSSKPVTDDREDDQGFRWEAPYAQLMLWRMTSTGMAQTRTEVEKAQEILDEILVAAEKRLSAALDGYLLFSFENEPDEDIRFMIRSLELDTSVCRKSFIWPREGDTPEDRWQRLWRTTVIGLPKSPTSEMMAGLPELKEPLTEIWREISRSGSAKAARKMLKECRRW